MIPTYEDAPAQWLILGERPPLQIEDPESLMSHIPDSMNVPQMTHSLQIRNEVGCQQMTLTVVCFESTPVADIPLMLPHS